MSDDDSTLIDAINDRDADRVRSLILDREFVMISISGDEDDDESVGALTAVILAGANLEAHLGLLLGTFCIIGGLFSSAMWFIALSRYRQGFTWLGILFGNLVVLAVSLCDPWK